MVDGRLRNGRIGFNRLTSRRNVCRYERFEWGRCTFRNASSDCRDGNNSRNTAHKLCCAAQYYSSRASTRNKSAAGMGLESIRAARVSHPLVHSSQRGEGRRRQKYVSSPQIVVFFNRYEKIDSYILSLMDIRFRELFLPLLFAEDEFIH